MGGGINALTGDRALRDAPPLRTAPRGDRALEDAPALRSPEATMGCDGCARSPPLQVALRPHGTSKEMPHLRYQHFLNIKYVQNRKLNYTWLL